MRFQAMAPVRAARITMGSMMRGSITPLPMVFATWRPKNRNAMKLKKAAQITACEGRSTRVETMVAMELAASWKPLMKSKANAMKTMKPMKISWLSISGVLDDDAVQDIG